MKKRKKKKKRKKRKMRKEEGKEIDKRVVRDFEGGVGSCEGL